MSGSVGKGAPARTSAAPDAHRPGCGRGGRGWLWRACFRLGDPASLREEPEGGSPAQAAGPEAAVTPEAGSPGDAQAADTGREPTRVPAAGSSPGRGPGLEGGRPPDAAVGRDRRGRWWRAGPAEWGGLCARTAALSRNGGMDSPLPAEGEPGSRLSFTTMALRSPRNPPTVWWSGIPIPQAATCRCRVPSAESRRPGAIPGRPAAVHMTALGRPAVCGPWLGAGRVAGLTEQAWGQVRSAGHGTGFGCHSPGRRGAGPRAVWPAVPSARPQVPLPGRVTAARTVLISV